MKLLRSPKPDGGPRSFVFLISSREKDALMATLRLYPMLEGGYHRLSRDPKATGPAEQQWLEEAMTQLKEEHKKKIGQFLKNDRRCFTENNGDFRLALTGEQMEWMLRVLNDIRVGSWVRLGRPEMEAARRLILNSEKARFLATMELSGYFQSVLLEAFS